MHKSAGVTWFRLSMVCRVSCATVSLLEMLPVNAVSEKMLKMVHTMVSSRPAVV
jgi:hypothetical protein